MSSSVLERPTLVLNRNWQPVAVSTVARALIKVWNESARIVDPSNFQIYGWEDWSLLCPADVDPVIRTQWLTLKVPEVITLTRYDRLPVKIVAFSRRNVFKRDGFMCQYCGCKPGSEELTIDHVVPRSRGGADTWENLVACCLRCNNLKGDRTPQEMGWSLRSLPRAPHGTAWLVRGVERAQPQWEEFLTAAAA